MVYETLAMIIFKINISIQERFFKRTKPILINTLSSNVQEIQTGGGTIFFVSQNICTNLNHCVFWSSDVMRK